MLRMVDCDILHGFSRRTTTKSCSVNPLYTSTSLVSVHTITTSIRNPTPYPCHGVPSAHSTALSYHIDCTFSRSANQFAMAPKVTCLQTHSTANTSIPWAGLLNRSTASILRFVLLRDTLHTKYPFLLRPISASKLPTLSILSSCCHYRPKQRHQLPSQAIPTSPIRLPSLPLSTFTLAHLHRASLQSTTEKSHGLSRSNLITHDMSRLSLPHYDT